MTILLVNVQPLALAQTAWEEDGWLRTSFAEERLASGDEFGCYGMPGLSWSNDPGAVAQACYTYLSERVNASSWGPNPLSIYTPNTLTMSDHQKVASQGFVIHGDDTGLSDSAWHSALDQPVDIWDWYNLGRRGGSLEQGIASLSQVQSAIEEGGLVNMYWIGRVGDATIRHDREVLDYIDEQPNIWLTTWGEAWSLWSGKRCYELHHSVNSSAEETVIHFESLETKACTGVSQNLPWNVPLTWLISTDGALVTNVTDHEGTLQSIDGSRSLQEGWRQAEDGTLVLSLTNGHAVDIQLAGSDVDYDILGQANFYNNYSSALTIAGHQTTDLFRWSKRFLEDTEVHFTWLLQPQEAAGVHGWIPYAVVSVGFTSVVTMLVLLRREGIVSFAQAEYEIKIEKTLRTTSKERSLDGEDET